MMRCWHGCPAISPSYVWVHAVVWNVARDRQTHVTNIHCASKKDADLVIFRVLKFPKVRYEQ